MSSKAVFLDRDGTIAYDVHYCSHVEDFKLLPTVPEAIKLLNENNFKVIIVTNQSGIARGYFNKKTLAQIHQRMETELAQCRALVDAIYYCPHHPEKGCECRKPKTGLILQASKELGLSLDRSFLVGDMQTDIKAGKAAGCQTVLVTTGPHPTKVEAQSESPNYIAGNLLKAARWIVSR